MTKNFRPSGELVAQEITSPPPLFNLQKFQDSEKTTAESCRMHLHVMKDKEFTCLNLLKLKSNREEQIN